MLEIIQALILGIIQGATEFIPISSSGHLVIIPWLLGWEPSTLLFDTILHWGTLISILLVFWRDFWLMIQAALKSIVSRSLSDPNARLAWFIVIATIPAAFAGLLLSDFLETLLTSETAPTVASIALLITACLLFGSEQMTQRLHQNIALNRLKLSDALFIGMAQVLALAPGVSRSGSTIAAGLTRGLTREAAARFSFLLGTPIFLGAGLLELGDALTTDVGQVAAQLPSLLVGFIASAITGFIAIRFLLGYLRDNNNNLYIFATYCLIAGIVVLGLSTLWA